MNLESSRWYASRRSLVISLMNVAAGGNLYIVWKILMITKLIFGYNDEASCAAIIPADFFNFAASNFLQNG